MGRYRNATKDTDPPGWPICVKVDNDVMCIPPGITVEIADNHAKNSECYRSGELVEVTK